MDLISELVFKDYRINLQFLEKSHNLDLQIWLNRTAVSSHSSLTGAEKKKKKKDQ